MKLRITLASGPAAEPLTTSEAKAHMRVTTADDNTYIDNLVKSARLQTEEYLKSALINQTWNYYLDWFPDLIEVPRPPLSSVVSIKYIDTDGVEQTLATSVYTVDTDSFPGRIYRSYNQIWPVTRDVEKAVNIEFVAGYASGAAGVPQPIKQALLLQVGHLYANREDVADVQTYPLVRGSRDLLAPYRCFTF